MITLSSDMGPPSGRSTCIKRKTSTIGRMLGSRSQRVKPGVAPFTISLTDPLEDFVSHLYNPKLCRPGGPGSHTPIATARFPLAVDSFVQDQTRRGVILPAEGQPMMGLLRAAGWRRRPVRGKAWVPAAAEECYSLLPQEEQFPDSSSSCHAGSSTSVWACGPSWPAAGNAPSPQRLGSRAPLRLFPPNCSCPAVSCTGYI
nr:uncharacterized protein LOC105877227 isoform X2 [Microcebus murinus]